MTDPATIPTQELIDDYYASLMDYKTCWRLRAVASGQGRAGQVLEDRITGNYRIMVTIRRLLEERQAPELEGLAPLPESVDIEWSAR